MKKRFIFSLDQELIEVIKLDLRELRLPPATLSNIIEDQLRNLSPIIKKMAEKKRSGEQLSFEEVADMMIKIVEKEDK